jgi:rhamnulokinase
VRMRLYAAVDLGASSGRVIVGSVGPGVLQLRKVYRFANEPMQLSSGLHWNIHRILDDVTEGLRLAAINTELSGIGIDSWAIDYGLVDSEGTLLGDPFHYRDSRTATSGPAVGAIGATQLYAINGLQHLPFTTIHQLATEPPDRLAYIQHLLLIPDLLTYWLTGVAGTEITNASTTGLLDVGSRVWSTAIVDALGFPSRLLAALRSPGDTVGPLQQRFAELTGIGAAAPVITVGSHDTASAVVGVPLDDDKQAYICCGTWGLVGVELDAPVLTGASRLANFTNELGVDGRVRYLRNVMGLWLLQESLREWVRNGLHVNLEALLSEAAEVPAGGPTIDMDQAEFVSPGDMPQRILDACIRAGKREPQNNAQIVRCILDSLADAFARTVRDAARLSGRQVNVIRIVGGGAMNSLLCQLTANACELPVIAGPVEATAIGNVLVQARATGSISGSLESLRDLVRSTHDLRTYRPRAAS